MDYGIIPAGLRRLAERLKMKIKMTDEFDMEFVVYAVDGREIEVPKEIDIEDENNLGKFTTNFIVSEAMDRKTKEPVSEEIRSALAAHIKEGCTRDGVKFSIN